MAQAGRKGTAPSDEGFDYTARAKPGKATWARGFRLTDVEYRANSVYLTTRLERHKGIQWDYHMRTSVNAQAIDEIIDDFKVRFPSFWDFITEESWVNWALRGITTTDARRIKKKKTSRGKHAASKHDSDDDDNADDKSDVDPDNERELAATPPKRASHRSSTEMTDNKQETLQPPTGSHDAVTSETVVVFWAASNMNEILHFCSVSDISRVAPTAEWKAEYLDYELYRKEAKKIDGFDEATCWFRTVEKYADYTTRMSIPVRNQQSLLLAAKILQKPPRHEEWNFILVRNKAAIGQHDPTSVTQQPASVGRSGLTSATTKDVDDLETVTRQMSIERREEAIAKPSIESGNKVPALNSNRAYEEEDDESDIRLPRRNLRRSDHSIRRHAKRSISEVEENSENENGDIDETPRKSNRTTNKHRPQSLRPRKHSQNDSDDEIMVDTSVMQGEGDEEEEEEEAEQEADRRNDRTIIVPMDDVNVTDSHSSQGGEIDDMLLCSSAEEGDNWPEEDYSPDNVNGRLPDPDGDTGSDICSEYDDDKVESRSGFIEQENLDFNDLEDGAEAVERVARTTIAEQMGDGVAESVAAFFDEDVENIKLRTHKVWIPGMKKKDEKGDPVGLLSFQLFGVRFLIGNIKSIACGGFLCDDMGLGKTLQGLSVAQVLHNHSELSYLVEEAVSNADGTRTDKDGNVHQGKGQAGPCPSQKTIKRRFGICCNCWKGSPTDFDVREGPVLNNVPSQLVWNWHRDWKRFFDPTHPLCIKHKVAHGSARIADRYDPRLHGPCDPATGVAPVGSNKFFVTTSPRSAASQLWGKERNTFQVQAYVKSGPNQGQLGKRMESGCWWRSQTNWSLCLRDECHTEKGEGTVSIKLFSQVNYGWTDEDPANISGREHVMAQKSLNGHRRPDHLRVVCKSMTAPPVVCLSGTPFEVSPLDLKGYVAAMQDAAGYISPGDDDERYSLWETHDMLKFCTTECIDKLETDYSTLTAETDENPLDDDERQRAMNRLARGLGFILKALTIRRQKGSNFFGSRIVDLPPGQHVDVACKLTQRQQYYISYVSPTLSARAQDAEKTRRRKVSTNHTERRRSSFPYLGSLDWDAKYGKNDIGATSIKQWYGSDEKEMASPFYQCLKSLCKDNRKVIAVRKILLRYVVGKMDWSGQPKRFVLLTHYPVIAFIWYLWFKYMFCKGKAVLLNGISSANERENYIDGFQRASRPDWHKKDKVKYSTTFLIGTTGILGTGVTLNVAERMVLDCCLYVMRDEDQAYARIDRMGNLNSRVITYRLIADSRVELKILQRQMRRKAVFQAALDTTLREWLRGLEEQERKEQEEAARLEEGETV